MGKYNIGYHGPQSGNDLQGIATLTHDPIAIENKSRKVVKKPQKVKRK